MLGKSIIMAKLLPSSLAQWMTSGLVITSSKGLPSTWSASFATGLAANKADLQLPKKPSGPYFMFQAKQRPQLAAKNPKMSLTEQAKALGQQWAELGDEKKEEYKAIWSKEMEVYKQKMADIEADPKNSEQLAELKKEKSIKSAKKAKTRVVIKQNKLMEELGKPKPIPNSYLLFLKDALPAEKKKQAKSGLTGLELNSTAVKSVAQQWQALDAQQKQPYLTKYASLKEMYDAELQAWQEKIHDTESEVVLADLKKERSRVNKRVKTVTA